VVARQRDILKDPRQRAIRTRSRDFATTITDLQRELSTKDDVAKDIVTSSKPCCSCTAIRKQISCTSRGSSNDSNGSWGSNSASVVRGRPGRYCELQML